MLLVKVLRNRTQVPFLNLTASGIYKKRTWVVFQAFHLGLQIWGVHSKPKVSYVHSGNTQCRQNRTWVYFRKPTAYAFFTAPGTRVYLPKPAAAQNQEKKGPGLLLVQFVRTPPVLLVVYVLTQSCKWRMQLYSSHYASNSAFGKMSLQN